MISRPEFIKTLVQKAGEVILNAIPTEGIIEKEGRANFATAGDLASEKLIVSAIKSQYPNDLILSEETEPGFSNYLTAKNLWVIDPIDGTNNFKNKRNYSAVSIGYVESGNIKLGAVCDPFNNDTYIAEAGNGALLNGNKIKVSNVSEIGKATVATDNSYDPLGTRFNMELFLKINPSPWLLVKGSAVLTMCDVASGKIDLYFHTSLKPWDNAAAFLIAKESGCKLCDLKGDDVNFTTKEVVLGNNELVNRFLSIAQ
jgi:myo-inositol-1(or 4)-monophosphatase